MQPAMMPRARRIFIAIAVLAVIGVAVSSVSLYHHYDKSESSFCDFGGKFNCDIVNRSIYSEVSGVPVAMVGIVGYAWLFVFATFYRGKASTAAILLTASIAGLGFALYLTYIEGFVLAAWCVLCLSSLAMIFLITILSGGLLSNRKPQSGSIH